MKLTRFVGMFLVSLITTVVTAFSAENWSFVSLTQQEAEFMAQQPSLPGTSFSIGGAPVESPGSLFEKHKSFLGEEVITTRYMREFNIGLNDQQFDVYLRQFTDPRDPSFVGMAFGNPNASMWGYMFPDEYKLSHNILLEVSVPEGVSTSVTVGGKTLNIAGGTEYCLISGDDGRNDPVSLFTTMNISIDVPDGQPIDNTRIRFKFGFFDTASVPEPGTSLFVLTFIASALVVRRTHRRA